MFLWLSQKRLKISAQGCPGLVSRAGATYAEAVFAAAVRDSILSCRPSLLVISFLSPACPVQFFSSPTKNKGTKAQKI